MTQTCHDPGLDPTAVEPVGLVVFVLIGLFGGAHCLGMCGPLVTTYADRLRDAGDGARTRRDDTVTLRAVRQHALFNLGRTISYALLGGLFGLVGSLVFVTPRAVTGVVTDIHAVAGIVVGGLIVAMGIHYLFGRGVFGGSVGTSLFDPVLGRAQRWLLKRIDAWVNDGRILGLGAAHGLFPCPILYPAFLYAFVQGSPMGGAAALAALGAGTIPALFLYGTLFQSLSVERRIALHRVLGLVFVVLGYVPLQHGLAVLGVPAPSLPIPYYQPL
ncbi:sulfite exporter TauE/SafE family protein [Natronorubrum tibetense]|uniref:Urease accessory protein UreH-like transmembrane domain-containing protein n=1 Tax=Natronorubrum tibetense GA33 TaxID=1114856 RepID=L9W0M0_9EURY|nr:sulfite exporter TauE/SafE family protein [Natronorubrum tibetense]ELY42861.1 hypothetical protein C496_05992 [Natronorubrum tibetense GA33]